MRRLKKSEKSRKKKLNSTLIKLNFRILLIYNALRRGGDFFKFLCNFSMVFGDFFHIFLNFIDNFFCFIEKYSNFVIANDDFRA